MKHLNSLLACLSGSLLLFSCNSEPNCSSFKTGEFSYTEDSSIRIVRDENTQKEFDIHSDWVETYAIHWTGSCSYYLTYISSTDPEGSSFKQGDTMWVEITNTANDSYTFTAATKKDVYNNTMIKIDK